MSAAAAARGRRSPQVRRSPEKPQKWCWNSSWGSCRSHANASEGRRQLSTPGTGITKTASSAVDIFGAASTEYTLVGDGDGDGWLSSWTARRGSLSGKAHALASVQAAAMTSDLADITAALRGGALGGRGHGGRAGGHQILGRGKQFVTASCMGSATYCGEVTDGYISC
jgi:hypothetical protein